MYTTPFASIHVVEFKEPQALLSPIVPHGGAPVWKGGAEEVVGGAVEDCDAEVNVVNEQAELVIVDASVEFELEERLPDGSVTSAELVKAAEELLLRKVAVVFDEKYGGNKVDVGTPQYARTVIVPRAVETKGGQSPLVL